MRFKYSFHTVGPHVRISFFDTGNLFTPIVLYLEILFTCDFIILGAS